LNRVGAGLQADLQKGKYHFALDRRCLSPRASVQAPNLDFKKVPGRREQGSRWLCTGVDHHQNAAQQKTAWRLEHIFEGAARMKADRAVKANCPDFSVQNDFLGLRKTAVPEQPGARYQKSADSANFFGWPIRGKPGGSAGRGQIFYFNTLL